MKIKLIERALKTLRNYDMLKSGDVVEIITDKSRKGPNPDWLKFVKSRHARAKIRQYARMSLGNWISSVIPKKLLKK